MVLHIEGQSTRHRCSERESEEKKIIVLFLVLIMKKARSKRRYGDQNVDDVHGQDEDCGIYTIG